MKSKPQTLETVFALCAVCNKWGWADFHFCIGQTNGIKGKPTKPSKPSNFEQAEVILGSELDK